MLRRNAITALLVLISLTSPIAAQPADSITSEEDLESLYDRGFAALGEGNFGAAIAAFDVVSQAGGERAASARELARLARAFQAKQIRFVIANPTGPAGTEKPAVARRVSEDDEPSAGRIEFVAGTTLASLYGGITLVDVADIDDFRSGTLVVVGATAAGFLAALFASKDRALPSGVSASYNLGLGIGLMNGIFLAIPADVDSSEALLGLGMAGMAVGGAAGLLLADKTQPTVAQARVVSLGSTLGLATAGLGIAALDLDVDENDVFLILTAGLDAGAAVGMITAPQLNWSKSRAASVSLGMFLGGLGGLGVAALIVGDPEDSSEGRLIAASSLAGLWGGLALSVRLTRDMKPDPRFQNQQPLAIVPTVTKDGNRGVAISGTF